MNKLMLTFLAATGVALIASAENAVSSNTFAVVEVSGSATTNTIISVPWVGYTADGGDAKEIPVNRLVSPMNLTTGDLLIKLYDELGGSYLAWALEDVTGSAGEREWQAITTVDQSVLDSITSSQVHENGGTGTAKRGSGVWLVRQDPSKSCLLTGQWTAAVTTNAVDRGSEEAPTYTMLANPDIKKTTKLNDLNWDTSKINEKDVIIISTDQATTRYCTWDATLGWHYSYFQKQGRTSKEVIVTDIVVPAGVGFWYRSKGGTPKIDWSALDTTK